MNALHATGQTLETPPNAGGDFFSGTDASDIAVDSTITADSRLIAASASGAPGDSDIALQIAQLRTSKVLSGGTATFEGLLPSVVSSSASMRNRHRPWSKAIKSLASYVE